MGDLPLFFQLTANVLAVLAVGFGAIGFFLTLRRDIEVLKAEVKQLDVTVAKLADVTIQMATQSARQAATDQRIQHLTSEMSQLRDWMRSRWDRAGGQDMDR